MVTLRTIEEKDSTFIDSVYGSTREAELQITNWTELQKYAFIMMQSMAQLAEYNSKFPGAVYQIIVYNNQDAGRFYTWENDTEIRLIDITVLPKFRGRGIANMLLKDLISKSNKLQKKISLHVEADNPALQFYSRLGFNQIKNIGRHYYMEKDPELLT